jgi:hypothetical protein
MRCIKREWQGNQCLHEVRFASNPPAHHCEFELIQARDLTIFRIERWASLPIEQRAQLEVARLFAFLDAPLQAVEDGLLHRILNALVDIGREDRQFQFGGERCPLTRYRTRRAMIDESTIERNDVIEEFAKRPCVSLAIEAGTIERRHFLDVMILAPYSNLCPFLDDVYEQDALTSNDDGHISTGIIQEPKTKGVRVRSITGVIYQPRLRRWLIGVRSLF